MQSGALIAAFRGIYRVGHTAPSVEAHYLAAVRACGHGALLSGRAAAHLLGLVKGAAPAPQVTARTERRVRGVSTRQGRRRGTTWRAIPVTTPAETLIDLAAAVDEAELARACHEAGVRHHTTPSQVEAALARRPAAKEAGRLRRILRGEGQGDAEQARGALPRAARAGRPAALANQPPCGQQTRRLPLARAPVTVELDSYRYHHSRHAWEQDRRREREAYARYDQIRRYTWNDVTENAEAMLSELRALLGRPT